MFDVIKAHGTTTEVIRSFCTQSGAEDYRQWCDDHASDYGDNPPTYCVVPQPITSTSIDVFDEFDLRQDTEATFSVHAHGATLATIVEHQDRWVIQWTGRNLGTWDHPIQAFRGLVMHCIN